MAWKTFFVTDWGDGLRVGVENDDFIIKLNLNIYSFIIFRWKDNCLYKLQKNLLYKLGYYRFENLI